MIRNALFITNNEVFLGRSSLRISGCVTEGGHGAATRGLAPGAGGVEPHPTSVQPNKAWGALGVEKLTQMRKTQGKSLLDM